MNEIIFKNLIAICCCPPECFFSAHSHSELVQVSFETIYLLFIFFFVYTCRVRFQEFKNASNQNDQLSILSKCFNKVNHTCYKPVEVLYKVLITKIVVAKWYLVIATNEYAMSQSCKPKKNPIAMKCHQA